jgi:SagB-type dehydrogenase family enzyme
MPRSLHDLDFLTSVGLLVAAAATILTGIISDLWDLNEFWYHTLAGYLMTGFSVAHVWFNRGRLVGYARFRWRTWRERGDRSARRAGAGVVPRGEPAIPSSWQGRLLSRRGVLGLAGGAVAGLVLGRGLRQPPPIEAGADLGVVYHEWSKPGLIDALGTVGHWGQAVPLYKRYPGARTVALPRLDPGTAAALPGTGATILARRSVRDFGGEPLDLATLGHLLELTGGITAGLHGNARRAAPSSGALYPIELYVLAHRVTGLEAGVYHYAYEDHALELVRAGDVRQPVVDQGLGQTFLGEAGVVIVLTQILQRMRPKYQDRSYRYGLIEAGHVGENAYLAATALGLGACGVGAFLDDDLNALLGIDGVEEAALYLVAAGHPVRSASGEIGRAV